MIYHGSLRAVNGSTIRQFRQCIFARWASNGLGLWEHEFSNDTRLKIENYWRDKVCVATNETKNDGEKLYVLSMFPYPSGNFHMGHVRVYAISDSVARFYRMKGKKVIHPMGWDAFGLPAENAALERRIDPAEWTKNNIKTMKERLNALGCLFDWDREIATCDPSYYRWTQELFLKLYDRGLVYRRESFVNWDPVDCTVLAEEQVDKDNKSWRSGAVVEKKLLNQWFIKTTAFAESLYEGLSDPSLREWRDVIKLQKHWIGECTGTNIEFELTMDLPESPKILSLWTDIPEFIKSAKFVAVSKDSILAKTASDSCVNSSSRLLKVRARNPFTGEDLPIYCTDSIGFSNFRDNHLGMPGARTEDAEFCDSVGISYEVQDDLPAEEIKKKRDEVMREARERNIGGYPVSLKLRDWLISRQRYWGTPIPIVHCESCGARPVPRDQLPVLLPEIKLDGKNKSTTLREAITWLETSCPDCGGKATREADTMDTFVDSSWYFMRFTDPKNELEMFSKQRAFESLPVDIYIGGKEHAVLHMYYARFISHFLHSEGLLPSREPFTQLLVQGMIMGKTRRVKGSGKYLRDDEIEETDGKLVEKETGNAVVESWDKMSKSKYNGVDPMDMLNEYGADTTRLIVLADVAPTSNRNWSTNTFPGILNWQDRLWLTIRNFINARTNISPEQRLAEPDSVVLAKDDDYMFDSRNYYIKGVTFNLVKSQQLSVGISKMQGLTNSLRKVSKHCLTHSREYERALATQIIMLAPLAPQFASELWSGFCSAPYHLADDDASIRKDLDLLQQDWPEIDMEYNMNLDVFVNHDEVCKLKIPRHTLEKMSAQEAAEIGAQSEKLKRFIKDRPIDGFKFRSNPGCDATIRFHVKTTREKVKIQNKIEC